MSEEKDNPYAYHLNSNLVLQADRSKIPRRDNESTGEPTSLWYSDLGNI